MSVYTEVRYALQLRHSSIKSQSEYVTRKPRMTNSLGLKWKLNDKPKQITKKNLFNRNHLKETQPV